MRLRLFWPSAPVSMGPAPFALSSGMSPMACERAESQKSPAGMSLVLTVRADGFVTDGNKAFGESSPAKPALTVCDPTSSTTALTSSAQEGLVVTQQHQCNQSGLLHITALTSAVHWATGALRLCWFAQTGSTHSQQI